MTKVESISYKEYLQDNSFDKHYKILQKILKGKKIVVYGVGSLFSYIKEHYDLSMFNIIGVSDDKFLDYQEGKDFLGYKIIPKNKIESYSPDVILIGMQNYFGILAHFKSTLPTDSKIKVYPLIKMTLLKYIKENFTKLLSCEYDTIRQFLLILFPKHSKFISDICWFQKVNKNVAYINRNKKSVLKRLKTKIKKEPLKVVFYVYDSSRWKSQTIYDLMAEDEHFDPLIVVTKNYAPTTISTGQTKEEVLKVYDFFKNKNMNVCLGYDLEKETFIPFEEFSPDIIFYSHPWYVYKTQGPVICSKFALTYYVPYFLANTSLYIEYGLRFHQYVHRHYVLNNFIKNYYSEQQSKKSNNLVAVGHPQLDYFYLNKKDSDRKYVIYSPHWSICGSSNIAYSTFLENGEYILDYAKKHPEIEWVFKPHPSLYKHLLLSKHWNKEKIDNYWEEWKNIGKVYETGDYLDIFNSSYAMITDCGSFLTEYLLTEQPCIHLVSSRAIEYNPSVQKIVNSYYQAHDIPELKQYLDEIIVKKQDYKKQERLNVLQELNLRNNYCAKNIIEDIKQELGI